MIWGLKQTIVRIPIKPPVKWKVGGFLFRGADATTWHHGVAVQAPLLLLAPVTGQKTKTRKVQTGWDRKWMGIISNMMIAYESVNGSNNKLTSSCTNQQFINICIELQLCKLTMDRWYDHEASLVTKLSHPPLKILSSNYIPVLWAHATSKKTRPGTALDVKWNTRILLKMLVESTTHKNCVYEHDTLSLPQP